MNTSRTVLIIDDDEPTRLVLRDLVQRAGEFNVIEAAEGAAGLDMARRAAPDLILLDLMMPEMNGYEVCAALRADPQLREVPIFVLSAAEQASTTVAALEAGADDFLRKPCDLLELRTKIATTLQLNRYRSLAQERERLRWLLDRSLEPLIVANDAGRLVYANARARSLFDLPPDAGYDVGEAIGRHFRCEPEDAWAQLRAKNFKPGSDFAVYQPENEYVGSRWYNVELRKKEGSSSELLLKFTDQTGLVHRELETWTFQRMIFHKIRTPLNGLGNVLDLVAGTEGLKSDSNAAALLEVAQESARRLERSLLDVLSYHQVLFHARIGSEADRSSTLGDLVAEIGAETGLANVTLSGDELAALGAEQIAMLRPVLVEIFENYEKFSLAGKLGLTVMVARGADGSAQLECFAPGPVPPSDVIARLGRPYWQVQRHFTGEIPGMGLGLAVARLLLRSRGGDLQLRARRDGAGLITMLTFPVAQLSALQPAATEISA